MGRITLFAKGNVDVHDSLHSCRLGGEVCWNGVNEVLRAQCPGVVARLRHETATSSQALVVAGAPPPAEIVQRDNLLGAYPAASQFSGAIYDTTSDAIILSILPDVATELVRHRQQGYLLYPAGAASWPAADRAWLVKWFEPVGKLGAEQSMANLEAVISRIRESSNAAVLIYNLSPLIPGEWIHCFGGLEDLLSLRIRQFNLALTGLSARTGISIVDVDGVIAAEGAISMKLDALHLTPKAYRRVAEEVIRILDDLGVVSMRREL